MYNTNQETICLYEVKYEIYRCVPLLKCNPHVIAHRNGGTSIIHK